MGLSDRQRTFWRIFGVVAAYWYGAFCILTELEGRGWLLWAALVGEALAALAGLYLYWRIRRIVQRTRAHAALRQVGPRKWAR